MCGGITVLICHVVCYILTKAEEEKGKIWPELVCYYTYVFNILSFEWFQLHISIS